MTNLSLYSWSKAPFCFFFIYFFSSCPFWALFQSGFSVNALKLKKDYSKCHIVRDILCIRGHRLPFIFNVILMLHFLFLAKKGWWFFHFRTSAERHITCSLRSSALHCIHRNGFKVPKLTKSCYVYNFEIEDFDRSMAIIDLLQTA